MDSYRKIKVTPEAMEHLWGRTKEGYAVSFTWGEPDSEGFYTPYFEVAQGDRLGEMDRAWADLLEALPDDTKPQIGYAGWQKWRAAYTSDWTECDKCGTVHQCEEGVGIDAYGDTAIEAIRNLTARLNSDRLRAQ